MKKLIVSFIATGIILSACEKNVTIKVPQNDPRLVINGFLEKGKEISLSIGKSRYILEPDPRYPPGQSDQHIVKNAVPVIFENGIAIDTLVYQLNQEYKTVHHTTIRAGYSYTVKVTAPGFKEAEGVTFIPSQSEIAGLRWDQRVRTNSYGEAMDDIFLKLDDPTEKNFYLIKIFGSGSVGNYSSVGCVSTTDKDLETTGDETDPLETESCFDGNNLLMKDDNFNGRQKQLKLSVASDWLQVYTDANGNTIRPYVKLYRITEEYFKFARSLGIYETTGENPFAEPVNVFTNIKNGYGIFSAYTVAADSLR